MANSRTLIAPATLQILACFRAKALRKNFLCGSIAWMNNFADRLEFRERQEN
jgi:hypothetical protein